MDRERIQKALEKYDANRISDWSQLGRDLAGSGICMGMCLDWIRRILNKKGSFGTTSQPRSQIYNKDEESLNPFAANKYEKRFEKQQVAHNMMVISQKNTIQSSHDDEVERLINDFKTQHGREPIGPEITAMTLHWVRSNIATIQKSAYETFQLQWYLGTMKTKGFISKEKVGRKNNFDRIKIDTTAMPSFDDYRNEAIKGEVIFDGYIRGALDVLGAEGSCGILSVGKASISAGHDVAFYAPSFGTNFFYFDPNFGEFSFNKDKVDFFDFWVEVWEGAYFERGYVRAIMARFYWQ